MILDLCGGEASEVVAAGAEPHWQRQATLRFARLRDFGGLDVPADEAVDALARLGFTATARDAAQVTVDVPSWRNDIAGAGALEPDPSLPPDRAAKAAEGRAAIEPEADLIEEVLRLRGLDAVPPVSMPPTGPLPTPILTPRQTRVALARRTLAARGYAECVTFSFMQKDAARLFFALDQGADRVPNAPDSGQDSLTLDNPIAADLNQMRPTPVATLALAAQRNASRGWPDVSLFEIGPAYHPRGQLTVAAGLRAGHTPRSWAAPQRGVDAMDAKADVWAVLAALGVPLEALATSADAPDYYHPGRSGTVRQGPKTVLAQFGELHPRVLAALDLPGPAVAFEIFLDAVAEPKRRKKPAPDLAPFQPLRRDFAFVVGRDVPAETVLRAARGADRTLITGVTLFDVYQGGNVAADQKSLGLEVTFQPRERTLTDAEIEAAAARVVAAVAKATGAVLRS